MKYKFIISIVLKSLKENKLRSILTIITNLIGMTAILIVILTSSSLNHKVEEEVKGTDEISFAIFSKSYELNGDGPKFEYTDKELEVIKNSIPSIEEIHYSEQMMIDNNYFEADNPEVIEGENFDKKTGNVVIYNNFDPFATDDEEAEYQIGDYIVANNIRYYIIGITNNMGGFSMPPNFYIPEYLEDDFTKKEENTLIVKFNDSYDREVESQNLKDILSADIGVNGVIEIMDEKAMIRNAINSVTIFFVGIGSISLLVSLVAIINMLFVSVNERKSQIAILRALGMQKLDIAMMFIFESLLIIIASTMLASILATLVTLLILKSAEVTLFLSIGWIIFTIIFAIMLAVLAALLPALNSAKTNISIILR